MLPSVIDAAPGRSSAGVVVGDGAEAEAVEPADGGVGGFENATKMDSSGSSRVSPLMVIGTVLVV